MEFIEIFPEIGLIKEKDLQEKIVLVWKRAMEIGGWKSDDLFNIPFTLLILDTQVNLVEHTRAVTNCAIKIADALEASYEVIKVKRDYLVAGGLLHDVGKLIEYEYREDGFKKSEMGKLLRHPVSGANLASEFELPGEVIHIIYTHSKEGDNYQRTIESIIIHHSDFINFESLKSSNNG
ncbi:MAG: HDIG domain-containing protein [Candidatus Cloacimonadota bacterium]|nr:MAG: HDIG domain-containing protein [Candidatus Cloacimonadota bacterium]